MIKYFTCILKRAFIKFIELVKGVCYEKLITENQLFIKIFSISYEMYAKYNKDIPLYFIMLISCYSYSYDNTVSKRNDNADFTWYLRIFIKFLNTRTLHNCFLRT